VNEAAPAFIAAIATRDWTALERCFTESSRFTAAIPNEKSPFRDRAGGEEIAAQFRAWFGDADPYEVVDSSIEGIADRTRVAYRIRCFEDGEWQVVEQQAYLTASDGVIERMNLTCSSFLPTA
jgi:hypothetical protein